MKLYLQKRIRDCYRKRKSVDRLFLALMRRNILFTQELTNDFCNQTSTGKATIEEDWPASNAERKFFFNLTNQKANDEGRFSSGDEWATRCGIVIVRPHLSLLSLSLSLSSRFLVVHSSFQSRHSGVTMSNSGAAGELNRSLCSNCILMYQL
jgi:hypothetical protein